MGYFNEFKDHPKPRKHAWAIYKEGVKLATFEDEKTARSKVDIYGETAVVVAL